MPRTLRQVDAYARFWYGLVVCCRHTFGFLCKDRYGSEGYKQCNWGGKATDATVEETSQAAVLASSRVGRIEARETCSVKGRETRVMRGDKEQERRERGCVGLERTRLLVAHRVLLKVVYGNSGEERQSGAHNHRDMKNTARHKIPTNEWRFLSSETE